MNLKRLITDPVLLCRYLTGKAKPYRQGAIKPLGRMFKDLCWWRWTEGEFNTNYFAFGLNLAGSRQEDFIGRRSFLKIKENVEARMRRRAGCERVCYEAVTKDKFYSCSILSSNGIRCIPNLAVICKGEIIFHDGGRDGIRELVRLTEEFFVKNIVMESGSGVYHCRSAGERIEVNGQMRDFSAFEELLDNGVWVLQRPIRSHEQFRRINASALNTTRIVTIMNGNEPEYLCGFQGFATGRALTDSWSQGSVYVGIDQERECLKEHGITAISDPRAGLLTEHPDSKIVFRGYSVPFLREAIELCIKAHRLLYFNFIVGWDVAITDEGPLIVEANERPGMNVAQCLDGGLRKNIEKCAEVCLLAEDRRPDPPERKLPS